MDSSTNCTNAECSWNENEITQPYQELKWTEAPLHFYSTDKDVLPCSGTTVYGSVNTSGDQEAAAVKRLPLNGETTALLVVDVQPEYWSHCPMVQHDFPDFPANLERTVAVARERRAKIIWVRADYRRAHSPWLAQFERLRGKAPGFMVEVPCNPESETFTWEDFATPQGGEVVIPKSSWSSTSDTALKEVLRVGGIDTVLVCGLITSVCVQHSAFGVFEAGYRTLLVTDACADRSRARHEAALALYGDYMYELVTSHDLVDLKTGLATAKPRWLTMHSIGHRSHDNSSSNSHSHNRNHNSAFVDLRGAIPPVLPSSQCYNAKDSSRCESYTNTSTSMSSSSFSGDSL